MKSIHLLVCILIVRKKLFRILILFLFTYLFYSICCVVSIVIRSGYQKQYQFLLQKLL